MKTRIANYTFDASAKTVEFDDYAAITLDGVLLIVNVTDQIIIYNFADVAKGGTAATNILTLEFDTTAMDDADDLLIYYDDPDATQAISGSISATSSLNQTNISQTPTCSTSPAYTAGDAIGGKLTFAGAATVSSGSGKIQRITILCKTPALLPVIELVLFNQDFTAVSDNSAFNPSDSDMANCIGVIATGTWGDYSLNSVATRFGFDFPYSLVGTTSLYGQMVTRSAITLGSTTDLIIGLQISLD
jgi:hypothetical protein